MSIPTGQEAIHCRRALTVSGNYNPAYAPRMSSTFRFTSSPDWHGRDTLLLKIRDGTDSESETASAHLLIRVTPVNDRPHVGGPFHIRFFENDSSRCDLARLGDGDYDVETGNDSLNYHIISGNHVQARVEGHYAVFGVAPNRNGLDTLDMIVSDGELADTARITVEVYPVNTPPAISGISTITFPEDSSVFYDRTMWYDHIDDAETPDEDIYIEPLRSKGGHVYEAYRKIKSEPDWWGTDTLILTIHDESTVYNRSYSDTAFYIPRNTVRQDIVVEVSPVNDAPVLERTLPAFEFNENDSCIITSPVFYDYVTDAESPGTALHYSLSSAGSDHHVMTESLNDTTFLLYAETDWWGTENISLTVSDGIDSVSGYCRVRVIHQFDTLHIEGPDTVYVYEDEPFEATIAYTADNSSEVNFYISDPPYWVMTDNGSLVGTPREGIEGYYSVQLIGQQTGTSIFDTVQVVFHVTAVNDPPYLFGNDTISAEPGSEFSYTIHARDPDHTHLNYSVIDMPSWMTADSIYVGDTPPLTAEDTVFRTIVTDGEYSDTATVTIRFEYVSLAPVVASSMDIHGMEDQYFSYIFEAYDASGGFPMIDYLYLPYWISENNDTLTGYPPPGISRDSFRVAMYSMAADTVTLYIDLEPYNNAPVLVSPKLLQGKEDSLLTYKAEAFDPEDSTVTCYITGNPAWTTVIGDSLYGYPPEGVNEDHFMVFASDGEKENSQYVHIEIESVNDKPYFISADSVAVPENESFSYELQAVDPEDSSLTYAYLSIPTWCDTAGTRINGTAPKHCPDTCFTAVVSDEEYDDTLHVLLDILPVNAAPEFLSANDTVYCTEDLLTGYAPSVSDPDGDSLLYSVLSEYSWIRMAGDTLHIQPEEGVLTTSCELVVSDGELRDTLELFVDITPVNDPPRIISDSLFYVTDNEIFSYRAEAVDPDDSIITYIYDQIPVWLSLSGGSDGLSGTPYTGAPDTSFLVYASDGENSDTLRVRLTVDAINEAPVISLPDTLHTVENKYFSYIIEVVDPEGDSLSYDYHLPLWLTAIEDSVFGYPAEMITTDSFSVVVSDGYLADSGVYLISIDQYNDPPVFKTSEDTIDVTEHDSVSVAFIAEDPDSPELEYHYDDLPSWLESGENSVFGEVPESAPSRVISAYVNDGEKWDTLRVYFRVENVNDAPYFISADTIHAVEKEPFLYYAEGTDPEDSTLSFRFTGLPSWIDSTGNTISGTPSNGMLSDSLIAVVSDGVLSDSQKIMILIEAVNDAPKFTSPDSVWAVEDELFTYTATASDSDDVDLSYVFMELPPWLEIGETENTVSGIPGDDDCDTVLNVIVSDGRLNDTLMVTINLRYLNDPPVIVSSASRNAIEGTRFDYFPEIEDPDDSIFVVRYHDYPSWCGVSGYHLSGVPPEGVLNFTFSVTVQDTGLQDSMEISVSVTPINQAPVISSPPRLFLDEHQDFRVAPEAWDSEDSTITFIFPDTPAWVIYDDTSFFGVVPEGAKDTSIQIIASDGELQDTLTMDILVNPIDDPPYFTSDSLLIVNENSYLVYYPAAQDPEDSTLHYTFGELPGWLSVSGDSLHGMTPSGLDSGRIRISVSDGVNSDTLYLRYEIIDVNDKAVITSADSVLAVEDERFVYRAQAYDPDGTPVDFSFAFLPSWLYAAGDSLVGMATEGTPDTSFSVIAHDEYDGLTDTMHVRVTFIPVNDRPEFLPDFPDSIYLDEDETRIVELQSWYPFIWDDDPLTGLEWQFRQNRISCEVSGDSLLIRPPGEWSGSERVGIIITDNGGLSDTAEVIILVSGVNDPPVFTARFPVLIDMWEDEVLRLGLDSIIVDPDNERTSLSWELQLSYGEENILEVRIDTARREICLIPSRDYFGNVQMTLFIEDPPGLKDSLQVDINVYPVNDPPVVSNITPTYFYEDDSARIDLDSLVSDVDNDTTEISWTVAGLPADTPPNASETTQNSLTELSARGTGFLPGQLPEKGIIAGMQLFRDPLLVENGELLIRNEKHSVGLYLFTETGTLTDSLIINIDSITHVATFRATRNFFGSDLPVVFTATDPEGLTDSDTTAVSVIPLNDPPVVTAIPDTSVHEDSSLYIPLEITDADGDSLYLHAESDTAAVFTEVSDTVLILRPARDWNGSAGIRLSVSDDDTTVSTEFALNVIPVNDAPEMLMDFPNVHINEDDFGAVVITHLESYFHDADRVDSLRYRAAALDEGLDSILVVSPQAMSTIAWDFTSERGNDIAIIKRQDINAAGVRNTFPGKANAAESAGTEINNTSEKGDAAFGGRKESANDSRDLNAVTSRTGRELPAKNNTSLRETPAERTKNERIRTTDPRNDTETVYSISERSIFAADSTMIVVYPARNVTGDIRLFIDAIDIDGEMAGDTMLLTILPVNDPPVFSALPDTSFLEDEQLVLDREYLYSFVDDPDDPDSSLFFSVRDTSIVKAAWKGDSLCLYAEPDCFGKDTVRIHVSDGEYSDSVSVTISVHPVNDAPVFTENMPDTIRFSSMEYDTLKLNALWTDVDTPDSLLVFSYIYSSFIQCSIIDSLDIMTLYTEDDRSGTDTLVVAVSDGELETRDSIRVEVQPVTGIDYLMSRIPETYELYQNYPNPFNPLTYIIYAIPFYSEVDIRIYDISGREVAVLVRKEQTPNHYRISWDGRDDHGFPLSSGIYLYRLIARSENETFINVKKMMFLK
ncbi:MAG: tandem-95 repeat protein [Candidatus Marinimicrobia bacterium]|nr:tandem-95 repeat protein [Candidatus Neomarinimicrobiota bacterium]